MTNTSIKSDFDSQTMRLGKKIGAVNTRGEKIGQREMEDDAKIYAPASSPMEPLPKKDNSHRNFHWRLIWTIHNYIGLKKTHFR